MSNSMRIFHNLNVIYIFSWVGTLTSNLAWVQKIDKAVRLDFSFQVGAKWYRRLGSRAAEF